MKVLAAYNIKGGVGKSATAVNLAWIAAHEGARTLVWDLDPQGAATFYFRVKPKHGGRAERFVEGRRPLVDLVRGTDYEGLDIHRARFSFRNLDVALAASKKPLARLRKLIGPLASHYDYLVFDCPPGMTVTAEAIFRAADALVVPTIPTPLSLRTLDQLRRYLNEHGPSRLDVMPFYSMVDVRKGLHREICAEARLAGFDVLSARIPYATDVERMGLKRSPVLTFAASAAASHAYRDLWREIVARLA